MTLRSCRRFITTQRFISATMLAFVALGTRAAHADEPNTGPATEDEPEDAPAAKTAETAAPTSTPSAPPVTVQQQAAEQDQAAMGLVERLPPSAYPAPHVRGLHGGSLWLNSQGVQWPYYPRSGIGVSGSAWLDTSVKFLSPGGDETVLKRREVISQGRLVLRITPTYSHGAWFAQAQAELVANKEQSTPPVNADVDDLWIRFGKWKAFDLTVGRFEAFEVYHLGMGLDINTDERRGAYDSKNSPPDIYQASFLFFRPDSPGNFALHLYPTDSLRFEVLAQAGNFGGLTSLGTRAAGIFDIGWFKLKAAGEYQTASSPEVAKTLGTMVIGDRTRQQRRGGAGSAQFVLDPYVEFGANLGYANTNFWDNNGNPNTEQNQDRVSFGGFANAQPARDFLIGIGVNKVHQTDQHFNAVTQAYDEASNFQSFAAFQYFWESQLMVKLVLGYATFENRQSFAPPPYTNKLYSARLRFQFLF